LKGSENLTIEDHQWGLRRMCSGLIETIELSLQTFRAILPSDHPLDQYVYETQVAAAKLRVELNKF